MVGDLDRVLMLHVIDMRGIASIRRGKFAAQMPGPVSRRGGGLPSAGLPAPGCRPVRPGRK